MARAPSSTLARIRTVTIVSSFGSAGNGVRGPAFVGALCSAVTAYLAVRFLMRFFERQRLTGFAIYCALAGAAASLYFLF